jgi:pimeloyl-ACP methyl ester carboxylesterase
MTNGLRDSGYEVVPLRHPSCTVKSDPGNMLAEDANAVAETIRQVVNSGKDAVLIMHSYGGITGPEGTAIVCEEQRASPGQTAGRVRRLVFLAAHVLDKGISFEGLRGALPGIDFGEVSWSFCSWRQNAVDADFAQDGMTTHRYPKDRYYNDISAEDAQPALDMLQPMTYSSFDTPTRYAGWKDYGIPCTYIKCLKDAAVGSSLWEEYIARWKEAGVDYSVEELDTSHSPFASNPDALLEVLKRVVE